MSKKVNIAFLMHTNPTQSGALMSEIKLLNEFWQHNKEDITFSIITVSKYYTNLIKKWKEEHVLYMPFQIFEIDENSDLEVLKRFSGIITYPTHNNLFAGIVKTQQTLAYKIMSHCTNNLQIPIFIRLSDSGSKVMDYREIARFRELDDSQSMKNVYELRNMEKVDWDRVYWLANGHEDHNRWAGECLNSVKDDVKCVKSAEDGESRTIYAGDDVFFLINKNYYRYQYLEKRSASIDKLLFIGIFTNINSKRTDVFMDLFKDQQCEAPTHVFGVQVEELKKKLGDNEFIGVEEGFMTGDTVEYFEYINQYLGYIFIGKGLNQAPYIGKTVYDCVNARIPILVYSKCDEKRMTFNNEDYYFSNAEELKQKWELLKDPKIRLKWIKDQKTQLFSKIDNRFHFKDYCEEKVAIKQVFTQLF